MFLRICIVLLTFVLGPLALPAAAQDLPPNPRVLVETSQGNFEIELFKDRVPATVVNFLLYVQAGYYDGTVFHRIIRNVIAQGGGFTVDDDDQLVPKSEGLRGQILNEASPSLRNRRGTVAMARGGPPNSARQQFFVNLDDNTSFDYKNGTPEGIGYAVFGQVTDGMNVVQDIGRARTMDQGSLRDVPREPIIIHSIAQIQSN